MKLLNSKEIAARYRISVRTVGNWTDRIIPSIKIGGKRLYDADECDKVVRAFEHRPRLSKQADMEWQAHSHVDSNKRDNEIEER